MALLGGVGNMSSEFHGRNGHLNFVHSWLQATNSTTTVRVRRPASERLSALAKSRLTSVVEVVHTALGALVSQELMHGPREENLDSADREALLVQQADWDSFV